MLIPALILLTAIVAATPSGGALAQSRDCGRDSFSKAVDEAAAALRKHSSETQPRILAGVRQLKTRHGWRDEDEGERVRELLSDAETDTLDQKAAQLLATMDRLSEEGGQNAAGDCAKLSELRATAAALQAAVRGKTEIVLKRIDAAIALRPGERAPTAAKTPAPVAVPRISAAQPIEPAAPVLPPPPASPSDVVRAPIPPIATSPTPAPPASGPPVGQWTVTTTPQPVTPAPPLAASPPGQMASLAAPEDSARPPPKGGPVADTYSAEEIRGAARGMFGTLSSNLAGIIEYAFSNYGRPSAYVVGEEGGGAFLAGVRYGNGTLFMKRQSGSRRIYWHGPSFGYDFGASGSRTLFLIYRLDEARELYSGFSGIDGSAYFVGGAGITFLSNNKVVMAPIRTGLGFRLGANVGYLRFTPKPTWNPF